jgi:tetratricopeptide (TPR) repeat protein
MRRPHVALAAAVALAIVAPASADSRWSLLNAGSMTIIGDQPPSTLRDVATQIEQFRAVVGGLIHNADRPLSVPTVVFVVGSRKALEPLLPLYKGKPATIAGYFSQGQDTNYIVMSLEGYDESAAITYHEYTHLLVKNAVRSLPVWVNEGLAEYYSTYALVDHGKAADVGRGIKSHILLLRQRYLPIAELIAVDQSSPMYNEGERRSIFYAASWAAVHYLMIARPNGGAAINQYVTDIAEGRPAVDAFKNAFGVSPAEFDKELQTYLRRLTFDAVRFRFNERLTRAEPTPGRPMTPGEVDAWIGDAQRRMHRVEEAAPRIERAASAEPDSAATQMILGLLRLSQQNMTGALDAFGRAAGLAPKDFLTQYVCGISRVRADPHASGEQRRQALETLKRAVMLNGTSSDAHAALAYVEMLSGDTLTDARASIEHAIALSPGRLDYRLRFADIRLLQGDIDAAKNILTSLAAITSDSVASSAASTRLATIAEHEIRRSPASAPAVGGDGSGDRRSAFPGLPGLLLRAVRSGEERILGQLTRVDCAKAGVRFTVETDEREVTAAAARMEDVALTTFLDDKHFTLVCGARPAVERVYLTWQPDTRWGAGVVGTAMAVEFLPKAFAP